MDREIKGFVIAFLIAMVPMCGVMFWASEKERAAWEAFKISQNCKVIAKARGSTGTGVTTTVGPNGSIGVGQTVVSTPDQTGWLCDDGVTYWR